MPINPSIPLQIEGVDPNSFTNALAAGMKMRETQNASQRLDLAENRLARKDEAAVRKSNALSKFGMSDRGPEALRSLYAEAPEAGPVVEKNTREAELAKARTGKLGRQAVKEDQEILGAGIASIYANPTRENGNAVLDGLAAQGIDVSRPRKQWDSTPDQALKPLAEGWAVPWKDHIEADRKAREAEQPDLMQTSDGLIDRKNPEGGIIQVPGQGETPSAQRERHFQAQQDATDRRLNIAEQRQEAQDKRAQIADEVASGQRLTPADASKVQQKLVRIDAMKRQLALVKTAWEGAKNEKTGKMEGGIKDTYSAGPGAEWLRPDLASEGGEKFNKAVASLASSKTAMLRTPGVGTMSDYDQKLDVADLPSRNTHEGTTEQQITAYENMIADMESGYRALLAGPDAAQGGAGKAPAAPTQAGPAAAPPMDHSKLLDELMR